MQAKETVQTRWNRLRRQRGTGEKVSVDATALMRFADTAIHFLLAAVLAGASVFGDYAPFGVALVGAAGSGVCGAAALVGACFGYMVLLGFADGLRYAAAAILTFAVGFAFYDWKLLRRPWAMPLVAGFINSCTGFIYLSEGGWRTVDVIYFLTELVLIVASGWCYRQLLLPMRAGRGVELLSPARRASLTVLLCTVLMSLSGLYLVKDISLGRALAVAAVLAAAWQGGIAAGAVLGMAAGLSMDLAANGVPLYAMAFGLSGLATGAVRGKGRLRAAGVYLLANGGAVLWTWDRGLPLSVLYEALLGAAAFLLLPERPLRRLGSWLAPEGSVSADQRAQARVKQRLEATAQAFRTLYDTMRASFCPPRNDNDMATVFDRAACRVCRGCTLRSSCWERDYVTTFNALNDATQAMLDRGRGEAEDFPGYFSSRCLHFRAFLAAVNEELTALLYRYLENITAAFLFVRRKFCHLKLRRVTVAFPFQCRNLTGLILHAEILRLLIKSLRKFKTGYLCNTRIILDLRSHNDLSAVHFLLEYQHTLTGPQCINCCRQPGCSCSHDQHIIYFLCHKPS